MSNNPLKLTPVHKLKQSGRCNHYGIFVIAACGYITAAMVPDTFPLKGRTVWNASGGSGIIGPTGQYVAGPVYDKEEIVYGEIDPREIVKAKAVCDVVGHYARPDIVRLVINDKPTRLVETFPSSGTSGAGVSSGMDGEEQSPAS